MRRILLVLATFASAAAAPAVADRQLHWRELDVRARLEADGTLAVSERHAMVFTGDWNGGERVFRLATGQQLELDDLYRSDGGGDWRRLEPGSLDRVDHWKWSDSKTLRWRSRLPGDPPFAGREIGYRIDYRLTGILQRRGESWGLDHDFAFPDRAGPIERFTLDLELAPEWAASRGLPAFAPVQLPPGRGYVVTVDLEYRGAGEPDRATPYRLSGASRAAALAIAALGVLALMGWAISRERRLGRLAPLPDGAGIDRAWIESRLLNLSPEEVGAAWDEAVGAAEVAALLARLQLEGKLASRLESKRILFFQKTNLHLSLLVPRSQLTDAERAVIDGLFPSGNETDTESLREHYKTSGFDPASKLKPKLLAMLRRRRDLAGTRARPARWPSMVLVIAGAAGLVLAAVLGSPTAVLLGGVLLASWIPAFAGAMVLRERVVGFAGPAFAIGIGLAVGLAALAVVPALPLFTPLALGAGVALFLGLARTVATAMQSRQDATRIARRRELAAARDWMSRELERREPALDDAWMPYLVAFGLAPQMDRWFRSFGGAARDVSAASGGGFTGGGASAGGSWTGGGGSFGGAGASAGWAAAATSIGAGVAAASSSSGGGGGGGGGGSSGGGGGGGW